MQKEIKTRRRYCFHRDLTIILFCTTKGLHLTQKLQDSCTVRYMFWFLENKKALDVCSAVQTVVEWDVYRSVGQIMRQREFMKILAVGRYMC